MIEQDLPEKEKELLRKIRNKHRVRFEPLRLGPHEMRLLQITDLEPLLGGKDPFADVSSFPFWVKLWEASLILADFISRKPPRKEGMRLLELGAGLGVPGLVAAKTGYVVTSSDYDDLALDFLRINAAANSIQDMDFKKIDWLKPPSLAKFDIIIGAEILFREDLFQPLLALCRDFLLPEGVIYLTHDMRRKSLHPFLKKAEEEYQVAVSPRKMKTEDGEITIILSRLTPRGAV